MTNTSATTCDQRTGGADRRRRRCRTRWRVSIVRVMKMLLYTYTCVAMSSAGFSATTRPSHTAMTAFTDASRNSLWTMFTKRDLFRRSCEKTPFTSSSPPASSLPPSTR